MKYTIAVVVILALLIQPVSALELDLPATPKQAELLMPEKPDTFGNDFMYILKNAFEKMMPKLDAIVKACLQTVAVIILLSVLERISKRMKELTQLLAPVLIGLTLLEHSVELMQFGKDTVLELSQYGKLLLPVLTAAMAAQGGTATSAALYTATALFSSILSQLITKITVPFVGCYLAVSVAYCATGEDILKRMQNLLKWFTTWSLKIVLYVFMGYISVTGIVNGSADASAVKMTKLAISNTVPVIGKILSETSETILISAQATKSTIGIYGITVLIALLAGPFIKIGAQYIIMKLTSACCSVLTTSRNSEMIDAFSDAAAMILSMISVMCLLLMIGVFCFMKGVS
jgi:stage III sporulation protein AE